jgi:spermidine synthase
MTLAWGSDNLTLPSQPVELIAQRFAASGIKTRYYNPAMHCGSFALPQFVVDALKDA